MSKLVGALGALTMCPGYPRLTINENSEELQINYTSTAAALPDLPQMGSLFTSSDPALSFFSGRNLPLRSLTITPQPGYEIFRLELVYSNDGADESSGGVNTEYEYSTEEVQYPLAEHPDYLVKWDHQLVAAAGTTVIPSWWDTLASAVVPADDAYKYKILRRGDAAPEGWKTLAAPAKQADYYLRGCAVVTVTRRSSSKSRFSADAGNDFTRASPPQKFGIHSGEWLRGGSSIRKDGKKWVQVVSYRHAPEVDHDLYD